MTSLIIFVFSLISVCAISATNKKTKKNVLNFGYGAKFKYKGMLVHSFDRFHVVTKFEMPKIEDLKLTTFTFDFACKHLISDRTFMQKYFKHCQRIVPYVRLYQNRYNILIKQLITYCKMK